MEKININNINKKYRIKIPPGVRKALIVVFIILFIVSIAAAVNSLTGVKTIEKKVPICNYEQFGAFNYIAYLKNNTLYNKTYLLPKEGKIFREITDHINASFTYLFNSDKTYQIEKAYYQVTPYIKTDIWEKKCDEIIKKTTFKKTPINIKFPVNYTHYEKIVREINNETQVTPRDSTLVYKCVIDLKAKTGFNNIDEKFTSYLNVSLNKKIITFNENLSKIKPGAIFETKEIIINNSGATGSWTTSALFFLILLIALALFTVEETKLLSRQEKELRQIEKKYGEWLVKIDEPIRDYDAKIIQMKSMNDLIKISEEIGKPIMHHIPPREQTQKHTFYIIDNSIFYKYEITPMGKITQDFKCPVCQTKITKEGYPGERTEITCPKCGNKGIITFQKNITNPSKIINKLKEHLFKNKKTGR